MSDFEPKDLKIAVLFIGTYKSAKEQYYGRYFSDVYIRILLSELITRQRERSVLRQCLKRGDSFVVDNPNLTKASRERYIISAKENGYRVVGYYFNFEDNIEEKLSPYVFDRELVRSYTKMKEKAEFPEYSEGFDELYTVTPLKTGEFRTEKI